MHILIIFTKWAEQAVRQIARPMHDPLEKERCFIMAIKTEVFVEWLFNTIGTHAA